MQFTVFHGYAYVYEIVSRSGTSFKRRAKSDYEHFEYVPSENILETF